MPWAPRGIWLISQGTWLINKSVYLWRGYFIVSYLALLLHITLLHAPSTPGHATDEDSWLFFWEFGCPRPPCSPFPRLLLQLGNALLHCALKLFCFTVFLSLLKLQTTLCAACTWYPVQPWSCNCRAHTLLCLGLWMAWPLVFPRTSPFAAPGRCSALPMPRCGLRSRPGASTA